MEDVRQNRAMENSVFGGTERGVTAFGTWAPTRFDEKTRRCCFHPFVNWYEKVGRKLAHVHRLLPAWIFYVLGAVLYIVIDILSATRANVSDYSYLVLFLVAAILYFVDSIFYVLAWLVEALARRDFDGEPILVDSAAWGEILYFLSAAFGLISAGCAFLTPLESDNVIGLISAITSFFIYASTLLVSNTLYLVDSLVYWSAWWNKRATIPRHKRANLCFDGYFWADGILLTIPSLGYFLTSFVFLFQLFTLTTTFTDPIVFLFKARDLNRVMRTLNVMFDFVYLADAIVYAIAWYADSFTIRQLLKERREARMRPEGREEEIALGPEYNVWK